MTGKLEVMQDPVAEKLDELADLCEHWKRNREKGRMPNAIRAALMMLAQETVTIDETTRLAELKATCVQAGIHVFQNLYCAKGGL